MLSLLVTETNQGEAVPQELLPEGLEGTITLDETCRILNCTPSTLHRWEADGTVKLRKTGLINKRVRYYRDEVEALAEDTTVEDAIDTQYAAQILGVSTQQVRRIEARGDLVSKRTPGNHRRYSLAAVQALREMLDVIEESEEQTPVPTFDDMEANSKDGLIASGEAEQLLGLTRNTLRQWEREGKLVAIRGRRDRRVYYDRETIEAIANR